MAMPGSCQKAHPLRTHTLWAVMLLAVGCATTGGGGYERAGGALPQDVDQEALEAGSVAEALLAVAQIDAMASGVREEGAHLSFTFWSEQGALTLTGYTAKGLNGPPGEAVDEEAFQDGLAKVLTRFAQRRTGSVELTLERHHTGWNVTYSTSTQPRPPEAKTLPVRRAGLSSGVVGAVTQGMGQVLHSVEVPAGGEALVELECFLEDGRAEEWRLLLFEVMRSGTGGAPRAVAASVRSAATAALLPFTQGVGDRTVRLSLRLVLPPGVRQAQGWVVKAEVERPLPPIPLNATFVAEYRAMHEDILRRWREESKEGAQWVALKGGEELAVWYAGGIALKGVGVIGGRVAPTVLRALQRGGVGAAGWLRTTLLRLGPEERLLFEQLWGKVGLEGKGALSVGEREELRALMVRVEQAIQTPLDKDAKTRLRRKSREGYKVLHPEFAQILDDQGRKIPIHHRCPLEYAHLFPEKDINGSDNLAMVTEDVHKRLNALWSKLGNAYPSANAEQVEAAARIIDEQFRPWYHQASAPTQVRYSLDVAMEQSLEQLRRVFPNLM